MKSKISYLLVVILAMMLLSAIFKTIMYEILDIEEFIFTKKLLLISSTTKVVFVIIFVYLISVIGLGRFSGLNTPIRIRDKWALYFPVLIIAFGIWAKWDQILESELGDQLVIFWYNASVALSEELAFRAIILPLFIILLRNGRYPLYKSVIYSSILFGVFHYTWLLSFPKEFWGITSQVLYALSMGMIFGSLMLRTGNVYFLALFHGTLNFMFGGVEIDKINELSLPVESGSYTADYGDIISTLAVFSVLIAIGLFMIREVDRKAVEEDLEGLNFDAPLFLSTTK